MNKKNDINWWEKIYPAYVKVSVWIYQYGLFCLGIYVVSKNAFFGVILLLTTYTGWFNRKFNQEAKK